MGCDIHVHLEISSSSGQRWRTFSEVDIDRDYTLFAVLAGVRNSSINPIDHIEPKGLPDDPSWDVINHATHLITDAIDVGLETRETTVSTETAQEYLDNEWTSRYGDDRIINSDYHSFSWLTCEELAHALQVYETYTSEVNSQMKAVLQMMTSLQDSGMAARLVFWFDN